MSLIGVPPSGAAMPGTPPMYCALNVLRTNTLSPSAKRSFISSLRSLNDFIEPWWAIFAPARPCGRNGGRSCRGTREFVQKRHLAEDIARPERCDLLFLPLAVLDDVDLARADDERTDTGVALADDLLPRFVALLHRGVGDRLE